MKCIVTAGPTYEPLDEIRRLTNSSTGKLGVGLANYLAAQGHEVILLLGYYAVYRGRCRAHRIVGFTTTADLRARLGALAGHEVSAVFHAAAVSDFSFGKVWRRERTGGLVSVAGRKITTRPGGLWVELAPTHKVIRSLQGWFPRAFLVGWKLELDGDRAACIAQAERQLADNHTHACVVNGRAYGDGFGLVIGPRACLHQPDAPALYAALAAHATAWRARN